MKPAGFAVILLMLLFSTCRKSGELSPSDRAVITKDVQLVLTSMSDSLQANGLTGWIPFLHNSRDFTWEFNGAPSSYDTLIANMRNEAALFRSITLRWESVQIEPLNEHEAHVVAKYNETVIDANGVQYILRGSVDCTLDKVDGSWKFKSGRTLTDAKSMSR